MQALLDSWDEMASQWESIYQALNSGRASRALEFLPEQAMAFLPRAYQWCYGSA